MGTRVTQELSQTYLQGRGAHGVEQQGMDISHMWHKPHFPSFTTVGSFIWKKILQHVASLALQEMKNEQRDGSSREERAEQRKTSPQAAQCQGWGETHCVPFSRVIFAVLEPRDWILEMLLEEKMYHKF